MAEKILKTVGAFIDRLPEMLDIADAVTLYEHEQCIGRKQEIKGNYQDLPDLKETFPKGVHSITSEENATRCQVFTQVGYQGASVTLKPGRRYLTLDAMGLGNPVMSLRKFYKSAPLALYQDEEYAGKALELEDNSTDSPDLSNTFPKGVQSIVLKEIAPKMQVFTRVGYHGAHVILEPGRRYSSLDAMGLENPVMSLRKFSKPATLVLYEDEGYGGKTLEPEEKVLELEDLTSNLPGGSRSIVLKENSLKLHVFTQVGYLGTRATLEPGRRYSSLDAMGLENPVKSMRSETA